MNCAGSSPDVKQALTDGFMLVSIDTWLVVIPQVSTLAILKPVYLSKVWPSQVLVPVV
jgi:hypothetical protein